ncbi:aminoacylase-1A-like [Papaver somniferum]|uniref:aminoacylase-1A-like n=1 Tax=Papaver somniferum TaxID=3469 RepID=UPI000E6F4F42|nr:aminoacylase-1A-like [Papaver somniferum]
MSVVGAYIRKRGLLEVGFSPMINTPTLLHDHNEGAGKKANGKLGNFENLPASTDARYFRKRGLLAVSFSPMINTTLLHDHNEVLFEGA